ncbi:MAG: tRNA lysidine(34) synthetase TilS [Hyphomicrobiales bacterium]
MSPEEALENVPGAAHYAVAVSGGSDSMAMLRLVAEARTVLPAFADAQVTALTVDHGLRPEAAEEAERVGMWCGRRGIGHATLVCGEALPASGVQAAARTARYRLMTDWCLGNGADVLLVAHTLDDQAETVLMRLARGSGVDGLSAMAPVTMQDGIAVARPLLGVSRQQLKTYLGAVGQDWIDDPSNDDERFERVRIRKALPELAALGLTPERLAATARRLQRVRDMLDSAASAAMRRHVNAFDAGCCSIARELLRLEHEETVLRVLARCLCAVGGEPYAPRQQALETLLEALAGGPCRRTLGGCRIVGGPETIMITREPGRMPAEPLALDIGTAALWDRRFRVCAELGATGAMDRNGISVRPLDARGWAVLKARGYTCPKDLRDSLVSFWQDDALLAVPHLSYRKEELDPESRFTADFCNFALLDGAHRSGFPEVR